MPGPALPLFRSLRLLRALNVLGVGCALAALTGAFFGHLFGSPYFARHSIVTPYFSGHSAMATTLPTLAVGIAWAAFLRWRRTIAVRDHDVRVGWLLSIPLALLDATLSTVFQFLTVSASGMPVVSMYDLARLFLSCLAVNATAGMLFWVPAMMATLVCFGIPIRWAQGLADRGLAGEERGERIVGLVIVAMSLLALATGTVRRQSQAHQLVEFDVDTLVSLRPPDSLATALLAALALTGVLAGAAATALAARRERRRRLFVTEAEAGRAPGFRVEVTGEGKVLVRVAGERGYRDDQAADEELFALDEQGLATHAVQGQRQA